MRKAVICILIVALVVLVVLFVLVWNKPAIAAPLGTTVLFFTGAVVFWYTVETAKLRRDAEARSRRERMPKVYFEMLPEATPQIIDQEHLQAAPAALVAAGVAYKLRFQVANNSENFGFALVRVCAKYGETTVGFAATSEYGGQRVWEITPFFRMNGWFNLLELVSLLNAVQSPVGWPSGVVRLSAQVDLYDATGSRILTVMKEYTAEFDLNRAILSFWPETAARDIPRADSPARIASDATVLFGELSA